LTDTDSLPLLGPTLIGCGIGELTLGITAIRRITRWPG